MSDLAKVVADLRREADANIIDANHLLAWNSDQFARAAGEICHANIVVQGEPVRIQFTRDRIGSRDFYHLSIAVQSRARIEPTQIKAIVAAFYPDGHVLPIPSVLGNCWQFLGTPFENGAERG